MKFIISIILFFCAAGVCNAEWVATDIAAGQYHTCAVISSKVFCWGYNSHGQIGNGESCAAECEYNTPQLILDPNSGVKTGQIGGYNITKVAVGDNHSCAIVEVGGNGQVFCWGRNDEGQLGTADVVSSANPRAVGTETYFSDIALSGNFSCGTYAENNGVACWRLGNNSPVQKIDGTLNSVSAISTGHNHACAIFENKVSCWGDSNSWGQLGDNGTHGSGILTPYPIYDPATTSNSGLVNDKIPSLLKAGGYNTFVKSSEENLWGFGLLDMCQVNATGCGTESAFTNVMVNAGDYEEPLAVGYKHVCGTSAGSLFCWGNNNKGQLGGGSVNASSPYYQQTPVSVDSSVYDDDMVTAVSAGFEHTCAIVAGKIYCWGDNTHGQLGDGTTTSRAVPTLINFDFEATEICGDEIDNDGDGFIDEECNCGSEEICGDDLDNDCNGVADDGCEADAIAKSVRHSVNDFHNVCSITTDDILYCNGSNAYGAVGDGTTTHQPAPFAALTDVNAVSHGDRLTCAIKNNGDLYCTGRNNHGQVGIGNTTTQNTFQYVTDNVSQI